VAATEEIMVGDDSDDEFPDQEDQPNWMEELFSETGWRESEPAGGEIASYFKKVKQAFTRLRHMFAQQDKKLVRIIEVNQVERAAAVKQVFEDLNKRLDEIREELVAWNQSMADRIILLAEKVEGKLDYHNQQVQEAADRDRLLVARLQAMEARLAALEAGRLAR
jgi:hypothetical protein